MSQDSIRIVLVGKRGVGKSTTGNTILGENKFKTSITKECSSGKQQINGREVIVVDTPGLYDKTLSNDQMVKEVVKCIALAAPGPHVILLVLAIRRFTPVENNTVGLIQKVFDKEPNKHVMVLFTRADYLGFCRTIDQYIKTPELKEVMKACEGYHAFNNRESDRTQVSDLMRKIEVMIERNEKPYYEYPRQITNELKKKENVKLENKVQTNLKDVDSSLCTIL